MAWGPDGNVYGSDVHANVYRWVIDASTGLTVGNREKIYDSPIPNEQMVGIVFDPHARADDLILWTSQAPRELDTLFPGSISRLVIPPVGSGGATTRQDYIVGTPAGKFGLNHMANGITFGLDGKLYQSAGSLTGGGGNGGTGNFHEDNVETPLSAAVIVADVNHPDFLEPGGLPVNVDTSQGYDPFAAGAKVTVFATGVRNGYDLVWHSNGELYVPINGNDTAGQLTPDDPDLDGNQAVEVKPDEQLIIAREGVYYGHPNPSRGEYISHAGNPTPGLGNDGPWEIPNYADGTQPEPAWDESLNYNLLDTVSTTSLSPDGIIEYTGPTALAGRLLIAYFAKGEKQIQSFKLDENGFISESAPLVDPDGATISLPGPLDLTVDPVSGRIYVGSFNSQGNPDGKLWLLTPQTVTASTVAAADNSGEGDDQTVSFTTALSQYRNNTADSLLVRPSYSDGLQHVELTNSGSSPLRLLETQINAPNVSIDVHLTGSPVDDIVLAPGETQRFTLTFSPTIPSLLDTSHQDFSADDGLVILTNAANAPKLQFSLMGKSTFNSDINYDGAVNFGDLGTFNANFGLSSGDTGWDPTSDINGDGSVNFGDLGQFNAEFGLTLSPAATFIVSNGETIGSAVPIVSSENTTFIDTQPKLLKENDVELAREAATRISLDAVSNPSLGIASSSSVTQYEAIYQELGGGGDEILLERKEKTLQLEHLLELLLSQFQRMSQPS